MDFSFLYFRKVQELGTFFLDHGPQSHTCISVYLTCKAQCQLRFPLQSFLMRWGGLSPSIYQSLSYLSLVSRCDQPSREGLQDDSKARDLTIYPLQSRGHLAVVSNALSPSYYCHSGSRPGAAHRSWSCESQRMPLESPPGHPDASEGKCQKWSSYLGRTHHWHRQLDHAKNCPSPLREDVLGGRLASLWTFLSHLYLSHLIPLILSLPLLPCFPYKTLFAISGLFASNRDHNVDGRVEIELRFEWWYICPSS